MNWGAEYRHEVLRDRPPYNEEDLRYGYFYLDAQSIQTFKTDAFKISKKMSDIVSLAEEQARFHYFKLVKGYGYAKKYSKKKPKELRKGRGFPCNICDEYLLSVADQTEHRSTNTHLDIFLIFENLRKIGGKWLAEILSPDGVKAAAWVAKAEKEGFLCQDPNVSESTLLANVGARSRGASTPMSDKIVDGIDTKLSREDFILATFDKIMEFHWPKETTEHFCKSCNYASFETEEELKTHNESDDHKEKESTFKQAWCLSCKRHTGSAAAMKEHRKSSRHHMMEQLLADTRIHAAVFWEVAQVKKNIRIFGPPANSFNERPPSGRGSVRSFNQRPPFGRGGPRNAPPPLMSDGYDDWSGPPMDYYGPGNFSGQMRPMNYRPDHLQEQPPFRESFFPDNVMRPSRPCYDGRPRVGPAYFEGPPEFFEDSPHGYSNPSRPRPYPPGNVRFLNSRGRNQRSRGGRRGGRRGGKTD